VLRGQIDDHATAVMTTPTGHPTSAGVWVLGGGVAHSELVTILLQRWPTLLRSLDSGPDAQGSVPDRELLDFLEGRRAGLPASVGHSGPFAVASLGCVGGTSSTEVWRLADVLARAVRGTAHLVSRRSDRETVGVLAVGAGPDEVARIVAPALAYPGLEVACGVGSAATDPSRVQQSRWEADEVLRLLRSQGRTGIGHVSSEHAELILDHVRRNLEAGPLPLGGPVQRLRDYDRQRGTQLVKTMRAFYECEADVTRTAAHLHVHHNTLRYRLRRASEVAGVIEGDSRQRLAMELELRLLTGP
jgi:hypothetical protein